MIAWKQPSYYYKFTSGPKKVKRNFIMRPFYRYLSTQFKISARQRSKMVVHLILRVKNISFLKLMHETHSYSNNELLNF